ncbi:MAG: efflux transporter outer membrane subunit, partial [Candidatus Cryptobacteroides sp.]
MKRNILMLAAVLLMSAGCSLYRKYERPEISAGEGFRQDTSLTDSGGQESAALLPWDSLFTDPHLRTLVREGLRENTDLKVALLKVSEAQARLMTSRLGYLPSLELGGELSAENGGQSSTAQGQDGGSGRYAWSGTLSASWEVDFFGKLTNAKRQAKAALEESEAYSEFVRTQVISTVAQSYYTLLMLDAQADVTRRTVESWEEYISTIEALSLAGQADRTDIDFGVSGKLSAEVTLADIEMQITQTENTLSSFLGRSCGVIERGSIHAQDFPQILSVGIPLDLLSSRPDIRRAEAQLKQYYYAVNKARGAFYPSITLNGAAGWSGGGIRLSDPASFIAQALGSLLQPLFNRGGNIASLRIAKAQQEEALLSWRQALLDAGTEV